MDYKIESSSLYIMKEKDSGELVDSIKQFKVAIYSEVQILNIWMKVF